MQALVDKEVVEHKSVVLWRANPTETATAFDQIRLEMFFGSMVFQTRQCAPSASHQELTGC
jgi:hypothetical protein